MDDVSHSNRHGFWPKLSITYYDLHIVFKKEKKIVYLSSFKNGIFDVRFLETECVCDCRENVIMSFIKTCTFCFSLLLQLLLQRQQGKLSMFVQINRNLPFAEMESQLCGTSCTLVLRPYSLLKIREPDNCENRVQGNPGAESYLSERDLDRESDPDSDQTRLLQLPKRTRSNSRLADPKKEAY